MKAPIPKNRMELKHFPKDLDLALVILFTLLYSQEKTIWMR
jgi:hypothetical protein